MENILTPGINDSGKLYLRKFAQVAVFIIVFIFLVSLFQIYFWTGIIVQGKESVIYTETTGIAGFHNKIRPYMNIAVALLVLVSNWYYVSFPWSILRALRENNEQLLNSSFRLLYRGAVIFLAYLLYSAYDILERYLL